MNSILKEPTCINKIYYLVFFNLFLRILVTLCTSMLNLCSNLYKNHSFTPLDHSTLFESLRTYIVSCVPPQVPPLPLPSLLCNQTKHMASIYISPDFIYKLLRKLNGFGVRIVFPASARNFLHLHSTQTFWDPPSSLSNGCRSLFPTV
jgi:hypothetical protein